MSSDVRSVVERLQRWARALKREVGTLALAVRDPRVPWYAKVIAAVIIAYALSPIDLIPDFIPVLGYLDDLVLVPLGILLVVRLIPRDVLADLRRRAGEASPTGRGGLIVAVIIVLVWVTGIAAVIWSLAGE